MKRLLLLTLIPAGLTMAPAFAESKVAQRKDNQQARIAQGLKSGELTAAETEKIEKQETKLNREVHRDRVRNGGNLTNKQKAQIDRQQVKLSKEIYREKHDGQKQQ